MSAQSAAIIVAVNPVLNTSQVVPLAAALQLSALSNALPLLPGAAEMAAVERSLQMTLRGTQVHTVQSVHPCHTMRNIYGYIWDVGGKI